MRRPPDGAQVLATSPRCAVQAIAVGQRAFGLQCHAEVDDATLDEWLGIPVAVEVLAQALGRDGPDRFAAQARAHMAACNRAARQLYQNFMTLLPGAPRTRA